MPHTCIFPNSSQGPFPKIDGKCPGFVDGEAKLTLHHCGLLEYLTIDFVCRLKNLPFISDSDVRMLVWVKYHLLVQGHHLNQQQQE